MSDSNNKTEVKQVTAEIQTTNGDEWVGLKSLAKSRKFVITLTGVAVSVLFALLSGDRLVMLATIPSIAALIATLVHSIAKEDAAIIEVGEITAELDAEALLEEAKLEAVAVVARAALEAKK